MNITIVLLFLVLFITLCGSYRSGKLSLYKSHRKKILILMCIMLFFFAALRGDFTNDYRLYYDCFKLNDEITYQSVMTSRDWLFWIITKFVYDLFGNYLFCYIIVALLMMFFYYKCFIKASDLFFLTVYIFIAVDNYAISFNLSRNILAVSICAVAITYIWEKKPIPYFLYIAVASMIHRSALIMIPMYWILQINYKSAKNRIILCIFFGVSIIGIFFTSKIALAIQSIIGINYESYETYGLDFGNIGSFFKTTMLAFFVLLLIRKLNYTSLKERVLFNGCILTWYLQLLAAKMLMIQRVGYYFSICYALLIPALIMKLSGKKRVYFIICLLFALLFYCAFVQHYTSYYFFWDNRYVLFN